MCELYKRINTLCEKRGITGYKLCKDIEMRPSILTDLKMGRTAILSTVNLNKIANYFSVSVDYLLNGEKETIKAAPPKNPLIFLRKLGLSRDFLYYRIAICITRCCTI